MITTRMKTFSIYGIFSLCLLPFLWGQAPKDDTGSGVVFIAAKEGPTQFLDPQGKALPAAKTVVGGEPCPRATWPKRESAARSCCCSPTAR